MNIQMSIRIGMAKRTLSQKEVADRIGIAAQTFSRLMKGKHSVKSDTIEKLAEVFGVSASEFIKWGEQDA